MRITKRFGVATLGTAVLVASLGGGALAQDEGGSITISGSSTVEPISSLVAEAYAGVNPNVTVSVDGPGTTTGFELFCNGEIDLANASRSMRDVETEACGASRVTPVELKVAIDGLAVIVSTQNEAVECFGFSDLYAIFGIESDELRTWEDVAAFAAELGSSTTAWPSGDVAITAPGDESGTWGSFIEITLQGIQSDRAEAGHVDPEAEPYTRQPGDVYVASPNDNVIIDGVANNPNGIGFVGYAYAVNNADRVRMVPIDGGDGDCVAPDETTVAENTYPISRDLYIYPAVNRLDAAAEGANAALAPFVDFYLSDEGMQAVPAAGYVSLAPEALEETRAAWDAAKASVAG